MDFAGCLQYQAGEEKALAALNASKQFARIHGSLSLQI